MTAPTSNPPSERLAQTYADVSKRTEIANYVRTAAVAAVNGVSIGEGLLSQIVDRATDDLHGSQWTHRSLADRIQIATRIAALRKFLVIGSIAIAFTLVCVFFRNSRKVIIAFIP